MLLLKSIIILIVGFVLLIKGADFFVEGSSAVAKRLRIPSMIIGMTIVAMGTSLPECAVSVTASLTGNNTLAISNAIGSNIFNLLVVCGVCSLFVPLAVQKSTLQKEFPLSIFCAGLLLLLGYLGMTLGHIDGIILIIIFAGYLLWMIQSARNARNQTFADEDSDTAGSKTSLSAEEIEQVASNINLLPAWKCIIFILGGMIAIKYGGDFVVNGASAIASSLGLSQTLIGLTIIAMGTSLPELVTSIVAAKKDEVDMAVGNVIGSNIFNILLVLGVAAAISPVGFIMENMIDIAFLILISVITLVFAWTSKEINRKEGIIMLLLYAVYMVYICMR
ncbi:calcium/sodium antiporter [Dorea sp.]|nr:calcium/sodium antiporter [uncultured Dorea sp.]